MTMQNKTDRPFVISRSFEASRETLWRAWTEPERVKQWWGPKGFIVHTCTIDLRPGGVWHYGMKTPNGQEMWGRGVYREIVKPERLVWVNSFSNLEGAITKPPFDEDWPMQLLTTLTLAEEENGTRLTMNWMPLEATEAERQTFDANHESMTGGWTGTFNQLEKYLANIKQ
jgi:uncharacterized protein YndB with AHSA1/START domain